MIGKTNALKKSGVKIPSVTNVVVSRYGDLTFDEPDYSELEQYDPKISYIVNVNGNELETPYNDANILNVLVEGENSVSVTVKAILRHFGSDTGETIMFSIPEYTNPALFTLETTTVGDVSGYKVTAYNGTESKVSIPEYNDDGLPILELNSINVSEIDGVHIKKLNSFSGNNTITKVNFPETTNESFDGIFYNCSNLINIKNLNTSNAKSVRELFLYCKSISIAPYLDTSNVINMESMFSRCFTLIKIPLYNTSNVTNMSYMFRACEKLTTIPQLDTSSVTNMSFMFNRCSNLTTIPPLNTSNVTDIQYIFSGCKKLITIPQLDTSNVTNMSEMFNGCTNLTTIPQLDMIKALDHSLSYMFSGCSNLTNITLLNIQVDLTIGSGTSWGHLLTIDSLVNTCKECIKKSASRTLTVGSANLEKLASVYIKFTDPSQTEIAVGEKGDIVTCESTDEGAMLISDYMTLKSWTLA